MNRAKEIQALFAFSVAIAGIIVIALLPPKITGFLFSWALLGLALAALLAIVIKIVRAIRKANQRFNEQGPLIK